MEPSKIHEAPLPQQDLTQPVGGCPSELRSADLGQGEHEGANPHVGQRVANEAVDNATAGTSQSPEVFASRQGEGIDRISKNVSRLEMFELLVNECKKLGPAFRPTDLTKVQRIGLVLNSIGDNLNLLSENDTDILSKAILFPNLYQRPKKNIRIVKKPIIILKKNTKNI